MTPRPRPTLVVGSTNPGKVREIATLLGGLPVEVRSLVDYPDAVPPEETGCTFAENARQKALALAAQTGTWVLADDSGLCVDALGGRPGVHSARYGGPDTTDERNLAKLLEEMRDVPDDQRQGAFLCAVALAAPGRVLLETHGTCRGLITREPRGSNGFGYDPVFFFPERGATFAEIPPEAKNAVSHRGKALRALAQALEPVLRDQDGEAPDEPPDPRPLRRPRDLRNKGGR